jgi:hypothetical protein
MEYKEREKLANRIRRWLMHKLEEWRRRKKGIELSMRERKKSLLFGSYRLVCSGGMLYYYPMVYEASRHLGPHPLVNLVLIAGPWLFFGLHNGYMGISDIIDGVKGESAYLRRYIRNRLRRLRRG